MVKDKCQVFMCMSCGNCKRKDGENGCVFSFMCKCGEFLIDAAFAAKIEFIGCRSWIPASDDYYEPYLVKFDMKHRKVEIGKWGKPFVEINADELNDIYSCYDEDNFDGIENACSEAYGDTS